MKKTIARLEYDRDNIKHMKNVLAATDLQVSKLSAQLIALGQRDKVVEIYEEIVDMYKDVFTGVGIEIKQEPLKSEK